MQPLSGSASRLVGALVPLIAACARQKPPAAPMHRDAVRGITLTTFHGDRIARDSAVWDALGMLKQLGVIPS